METSRCMQESLEPLSNQVWPHPSQVTILAGGKMAARCRAPMIGVFGSPVLPITMIGGVPTDAGWRPAGRPGARRRTRPSCR